ncbi:MAG: PAS domain-containing protein [Pseudolabrys sp.]|nr:PAS domain-containing protein [Pseudolabrys sp.]
MIGNEHQLSWLTDPRLAGHALSPSPVWLWRADAHGILWANTAAAAIFDAASPAALSHRVFDPKDPSAAQIARLSGTLPQGGAPRLERLRGFGAPFGGTLVYLCSRIILADNSSAILVVSTERAGNDLSLPERVHRLLAGFEGPAAIFSADGELIDANPAARERFGNNRDLAALGADRLAREASVTGVASGDIAAGPITMVRLGAGATVTLLIAIGAEQTEQNTSHAGSRASEAAAAIASSHAAGRAAPPATPTRRLPLRFVWQMDAATRITQGIENFAMVIGPKTAAQLNRSWAEIADTLKIDSDGEVARALATRGTWSGIVVQWPVDDSNERIAMEMSGLPVFDRDRQFAGYRGFTICRDTERRAIADNPPALTAAPDDQTAAAPQPADTKGEERNTGDTPTVDVPAKPQAKVLAFRAAPVPPTQPAPPSEPAPALSPGEHSAFEELARELNARLKGAPATPAAPDTPDRPTDVASEPFIAPAPPAPSQPAEAARAHHDSRPILDRLPVGILVYRLNNLIYANRAFLDWTGYGSLHMLTEAGGLDSLFLESNQTQEPQGADATHGGKSLTITTVNGQQKPVQGRLFSVPWADENALVLMINTHGVSDDQIKTTDAALRRAENENQELRAILDTATDGVLVLDRAGRVLSANRSAEALFGHDAADFTELNLGDLFAPESRRGVLDYLDRLADNSGDRLLDAGHEAIGRVRQGGLVPVYLTMGRIEGGDKFCAVLRDVTTWKRTEEELINARQQAERASTAKSEFLAKISHEIRTPLNAIIGFSEMMMDERYGAIGNDRYKQYLKDIHTSGGHLISLLNDLLDLSKIEAGKLDLSFVSVNLNDIVQQCVAIMQEQANRERVIIRTALPTTLPPIVADVRSVRQIAINLLSNSIKFTGAGGQVIVSTALNDDNEAVLRVRDTGIGMSAQELQTALEPFRQLATASRWGSSGTGLGLPITKALAEANHARFRITSQPDDGTLAEVAFPATRVLAE